MEDKPVYGRTLDEQLGQMEAIVDFTVRRAAVKAEVLGAIASRLDELDGSTDLAEWQRLITLTGDGDGEILSLSAAAMGLLIERAMKRGAGIP